MTEETPSFSFGESAFYLKDQSGLGPFDDLLPLRDKLWLEIAIADKAAAASKTSLLMQILAMKVIATLNKDVADQDIINFDKGLWCFMTQFQLSIYQFWKFQNQNDMAMTTVSGYQSGSVIIKGMRKGFESFMEQVDNGEI